MKLINSAQAAEILGTNYYRVASLVRQGLLNDYSPRDPSKTKHYHKLAVNEVRDFKKNYVLAQRGVMPRHVIDNGIPPLELPPVPLPTKIQSFSDRLTGIENELIGLKDMMDVISKQLDVLIKAWT